MTQSSIAWIDFAERDQRTMMEVISLFRERDTRDELGLGSVRDAFASLFFPGTSTIQTRARYFLFVPWIYRYLEEHKVASRKVPRRLKQQEVKIIRSLAGTEEEGIIGKVAGASLQRFPSTIYWNGLQRWGIRRFPGSQSQYHRWLDHFYEIKAGRRSASDFSAIDQRETNWDPHLPKAPKPFPNVKTLRLTSCEARYLRERLLVSCPDSILATIVDTCDPTDVAFIWRHPQRALFPAEQQIWIHHARRFSTAMYGAVILYNLMLAERKGNEDLLSDYETALRKWWQELSAHLGEIMEWDRVEFWRLVRDSGRIPVRTQRFIDDWLDLLLTAKDKPDLKQHPGARHLVPFQYGFDRLPVVSWKQIHTQGENHA
jgi:hypothetical protein